MLNQYVFYLCVEFQGDPVTNFKSITISNEECLIIEAHAII